MKNSIRIGTFALASGALGMLLATAGSPLSAADNPNSMTNSTPNSVQTIQIHAKRYQFEPSTITLKRGETVKLLLTSEDRTHGFMVKPLGVDTDIEPGKTTEITIRPEKAGTYTTICDHYCGLGHNGMKMKIVVEETAAKSSAANVVRASNTVSK
jgi:cytochrome c oxidase subunit 2